MTTPANVAEIVKASAEGLCALVEARQFIKRFVALTDHQATAVAIWVMHTHVFNACETTPVLQITSATPGSGKSRLGEVIEALAARAEKLEGASSAALFRFIEDDRPTLIIDEMDCMMGGNEERAQEIRGIINSGYRLGGNVRRCVGIGSNQESRKFSVFCPKVCIGIGGLNSTIESRSIRIVLQKQKRTGPQVEKYRIRTNAKEGKPLATALAAWGLKINKKIAAARPAVPEDLHDRAEDVWIPLLALADEAGGDWPKEVRAAAVALCGDASRKEATLGTELLHDIARVFETEGTNFLGSGVLVDKLRDLLDAPWLECHHGRPLTTHRAKNILAEFEIRPGRNAAGTARGYHFDQFTDALERHPRGTDD